MIEKKEVVAIANGLSLNLDTIEKDYVLSWLLWGINQHPVFRKAWLFKGGTCLKKCFFETFRFSEDLDFTTIDRQELTTEFLVREFCEIADRIYDQTGITFFQEHFKFKILAKGYGNFSAQGVIAYNGPLRRTQRQTASFATIKIDLTSNEVVLCPSIQRQVFHPYSDEPAEGIWANCYAFEELVAEKVRALAERLRPRDLYDVIHFFRNRHFIAQPLKIRELLQKKCDFKQISPPNYQSLLEHPKREELASQWVHMLAHQLPALPDMHCFWKELPEFFAWIEGSQTKEKLIKGSQFQKDFYYPGRVARFLSQDVLSFKCQFAAMNRVCLLLEYLGTSFYFEPIYFTKNAAGEIFVWGFRSDLGIFEDIACNKVKQATITSREYTQQQYAIEIGATMAL